VFRRPIGERAKLLLALVVIACAAFAARAVWRIAWAVAAASRHQISYEGLSVDGASRYKFAIVKKRLVVLDAKNPKVPGLMWFHPSAGYERGFQRQKSWCTQHPEGCTTTLDTTRDKVMTCLKYTMTPESPPERPFNAWCRMPWIGLDARYNGDQAGHEAFDSMVRTVVIVPHAASR
jgi:hypothetical protein